MSDDQDVKISIATIEQDIKYLTQALKDQKDLLNSLLLDSQKRNDAARDSALISEYSRKHQAEQTESVKYSIKAVQDRLDTLHEDLKSFKNESNERQGQMQLELDNFNSKVDDNWMLILKVVALVLAGALLGAGVMSAGLKGWLGL